MKDIESQARQALRLLLEHVPAIKLLDIRQEVPRPAREADIVARFNVSGRHHVIVCKVKSTGQPRHVRLLLQLRIYMAHVCAQDVTPVFVAPYLRLSQAIFHTRRHRPGREEPVSSHWIRVETESIEKSRARRDSRLRGRHMYAMLTIAMAKR